MVVYGDVPGAFSRIAGVLSLHGLDVLTARAHSDEPQAGDVAMARVRVPGRTCRSTGIDWEPVRRDLAPGARGELAIEARLAERARTYRRRQADAGRASPGRPA